MRTSRTILFVPATLLTVFIYNEFIIYYLVLNQCVWPELKSTMEEPALNAMFISDPHLLGPSGHWWDRLRREWQMQRVFQTSLQLHQPEIVFILGDIFDDGKWSSDVAFQEDVRRYRKIFNHSPNTQLVTVMGNHDVGFHYMVSEHKLRRFVTAVNSSDSIVLMHHRGISFVTVNSIALEGDNCHMCTKARKDLELISEKLKCAQGEWTISDECKNEEEQFTYSPPILLQHFPMYRESEAECTAKDIDSIPEEYENDKNKPKYDCLSEDASKQLMTGIQPRLIISGHTHFFCVRKHGNGVDEWSIPSFSWRNHKGPSFLMNDWIYERILSEGMPFKVTQDLIVIHGHKTKAVRFTREDYSINKCFMPNENTVYLVYGVAISISVLYLLTLAMITAYKRIWSRHMNVSYVKER